MYFNKEQINILKDLEKKYPNDMEYGSSIRLKYIDEDFTKTMPNDMVLGEEVRKKIKNL